MTRSATRSAMAVANAVGRATCSPASDAAGAVAITSMMSDLGAVSSPKSKRASALSLRSGSPSVAVALETSVAGITAPCACMKKPTASTAHVIAPMPKQHAISSIESETCDVRKTARKNTRRMVPTNAAAIAMHCTTLGGTFVAFFSPRASCTSAVELSLVEGSATACAAVYATLDGSLTMNAVDGTASGPLGAAVDAVADGTSGVFTELAVASAPSKFGVAVHVPVGTVGVSSMTSPPATAGSRPGRRRR